MPTMDDPRTTSELVDALEDIEAASHETIARNQAIQRRVRWLLDRLSRDPRLRAALASEPRPLIVEMVTANIKTWHDKGLRLRRAQARALRREGLTMQDIAGLFGVTRQRISALLHETTSREQDPDGS